MDVHMNELLQATIDEGGSDLHIRARMPPELRVHGELCPLSDEALTEEDSYNLVREISTDEQMEEVEKNGGADFALAHPDGTRFRVSVFKERKRYGAVLRQIPSTLLTLEQIGIPPTVKELLFKPRGLILVTGPTGSGKSTTLASMLNVINHERGVHITEKERYQQQGPLSDPSSAVFGGIFIPRKKREGERIYNRISAKYQRKYDIFAFKNMHISITLRRRFFCFGSFGRNGSGFGKLA